MQQPPARGGSGGSAPAPGAGGTGAGTGSVPTNTGGTEIDPPAMPDAGDNGGSGGTGSIPAPVAVPILFGQCEEFEACGGALDGSWTYTAACVGREELLGNESECGSASVQLDAEVEGSLSFAGGEVSRSGSASGSGDLLFPTFCNVAIASCSPVRALVDEDEDACVQQGIECVCTLPIGSGEWDGGYETDSELLTLSNGRSFEYCVNGDELSYREVTDEAAGEPGVYRLTRQ